MDRLMSEINVINYLESGILDNWAEEVMTCGRCKCVVS